MNITLTANAGVLIELDGIRILLDGVCNPTDFYLGTPEEIRTELSESFPDVVCFTHMHSDHYDESYASLYKSETLRPILGSECSALKVSGVVFNAMDTRHIGKGNIPHKSFIIEGSRRIFFMGDASPIELRKFSDFPTPDLLIVPFAYLNTESALKMTKMIGAKEVLLVHMPSKDNDPYNIWESVKNSIKDENVRYFTNFGDTITLQ